MARLGSETMVGSRLQLNITFSVLVRTPTTNPFLTNSKKIRRSKRATNTHKHGRRSYLSDDTRGDSQSLLEREPLRSKDRGLHTYNIDVLEGFVSRFVYVRPLGMWDPITD